jgi:hypothetical protein
VKTIIINKEEAQRLDYEHNWKDLVSFEGYLSILAQRAVYESNQKGYEISSIDQKNKSHYVHRN